MGEEFQSDSGGAKMFRSCTFSSKAGNRIRHCNRTKNVFWTGHHATTYMMLQLILKNEWQGKKVLDMGCGTGVLAILAEMKGAKQIDAIDIDNWCYLNTLENVERNNCSKIDVFEGDASLLKGRKYDSIIANINRNILLNDMKTYAECLLPSGGNFP